MYAKKSIAESIYTALNCIPPDDREVWVKVAMAVKSELGDDGFPLWDEWSQSAESYNASDAKDVWQSIKGGAIGVGTLFFYAKQNGYRSDSTTIQIPPARPIPKLMAAHDTGAYGRCLWRKACVEDEAVASHPYSKTKGIQWSAGAGRAKASGKVIGRDADCIVVPIYDLATSHVVAVQCINSKGEKQTFGPVRGNGLLLGNTADRSLDWYVCEGWASAVSVVFHHLHGNGVCAAAFGKGNQGAIARVLSDLYAPDKIAVLAEED